MKKRRKNFTNRKKRFLILNSFLVLFLVLGIGYSTLSSNLNIFGDITLKKPIPPGIVFEVTPTSTPENGDKYDLGEEVTFSVTITNNYPYELHDVIIGDDFDEYDVEYIAAYDSYTINNMTMYITEEMIVEGFADLHFYINASDKDNNPITEEYNYRIDDIEDINTDFDIFINYDTTKSYNVFDEFQYSISVQNNGNVRLTDLEIEDANAITSHTFELVAPGGTISNIGMYTITQADVDAGQLKLEATVNALDPNGNEVKKNWIGIVPLNSSRPRINLTYEVEQIDNTYVFKFKFKNPGNTTISSGNFSFEENTYDLSGMNPGDEKTYEYIYSIPDDPNFICHEFIFNGIVQTSSGNTSSLVHAALVGPDCGK